MTATYPDESNKPSKSFPGPSATRPGYLPKLAKSPWIAPPPEGYVFHNAKVVDAASGSLLDGLQTVVVIKGVISAVTPSGTWKGDVNQRLETVDVSGLYICPGLIDAHVHVSSVPGVKNMTELVYHTPEETVALRQTYTLRANALAEGLIVGPRLFQCGKAISQSGGHGDFRNGGGADHPGCCGGYSLSLGRVADGVPDVLRATREELMAGADFIKIMVGGGVLSETDAIESVQYSAEEVRAFTAHAYTDEAILHAVNNGAGGIEHGNLMSAETAYMMAKKGIYLTPTLSCYGIMVRKPWEDFLPESGQVKNWEVMENGLKALKVAHDAGVTICYGSDLLISMQALQTEEFTVRSEVLPSAAILRHATINPAKMLKQEGKLGVVAPGAIADLIFLDENPLDDITVLDRPEDHLKAVVKDGRVITSKISGLKA
ncbi:hypothetical protein CI109_102709 [Kwoniella shandongensis]|uniref:Amidohydrolase-related domain-containing protein n=1 Tax=Kwoniella shandongensis TaxID=1734106 RepID=A0AAJ8LI40_9TREE